MRVLIAVVVLAFSLWGGYWFVGSSAVESGLNAWFEDRQTDGWVVDYSSLETHGFPNRFDTTITDIELADPRTGVAWTAPMFQILTLSYKPHHIIAVWPGKQLLATPQEKITIINDEMKGSVVFEPGTSLTLDHANFDLANFSLTSTQGWKASVERGQLYSRQTVGKDNTHDIWFEATNVRPSAEMLAAVDPARTLPDFLKTLNVDSTITFDAPWDRFAIEKQRPQIRMLDLKLARGTWGKMDLRAAGSLQVNGKGMPNGKITVKARNWREMLRIGLESGMIPAAMGPTLERAGELVAGMSGNKNTIDAPLTFSNGIVSLGPIPLGPAPRLVIR